MEIEVDAWERDARKKMPAGVSVSVRNETLIDRELAQGASLERYDIRLRWPEPGRPAPATFKMTIYLPAS